MGEDFAAEYVERTIGWTVLERNWRCQFGELDIVAQHHDCIVAIEVKTRDRRQAFGTGAESVNARKRARLCRLLDVYLERHFENSVREARVDVIDIVTTRGVVVDFLHFCNAVEC